MQDISPHTTQPLNTLHAHPTEGSPLPPLPPFGSLDAIPDRAIRYLAQLRRSRRPGAAMARAYVGQNELLQWREQYPEFERAEREIDQARTSVALARAHMQTQALPVAEAMTERAVGKGPQAQRAGEAVLKVADVLVEGRPGPQIAIHVAQIAYERSEDATRKPALHNGDKAPENTG